MSFRMQGLLAMATWELAQKLRSLFLFVVVVWFACQKSRSEGRRAKTWALSSCFSCSVVFSFLTNSAAVHKQVATAKPAGICIARLSDHVEDARMIILLSLAWFFLVFMLEVRGCVKMRTERYCVSQLWTEDTVNDRLVVESLECLQKQPFVRSLWFGETQFKKMLEQNHSCD